MIRNDYLVRLIEQFVRALARMLGLAENGQFDKALSEGQVLYDRLGVPKALCDVADAATIADLLVEPEKIRALAQLLATEARVFELKADPLTASAKNLRAVELLIEAKWRAPSEEVGNLFRDLIVKVPIDSLPPHYQAAARDGGA